MDTVAFTGFFAGFLTECALCGQDGPVERPECLDGHGADCPEAFCALCGTAIWVPAPLQMEQATAFAATKTTAS